MLMATSQKVICIWKIKKLAKTIYKIMLVKNIIKKEIFELLKTTF